MGKVKHVNCQPFIQTDNCYTSPHHVQDNHQQYLTIQYVKKKSVESQLCIRHCVKHWGIALAKRDTVPAHNEALSGGRAGWQTLNS